MALRNRKLGTLEALQGQILQETDPGAIVDNERVYQGGSGTKYIDVSSQTYKTSIAKIRAAQGLNQNVIYLTYDFGVPGEWQVDPDDTASIDNTGTVLTTADGKRLKRRFNGAVNLRWFGAIGDGVTVETSLIQAALDASVGGRLFIPRPAVHYLTGQLIVPSNITVECEPGVVFQAVDTLVQTNPGFEVLLRFQSSENVTWIGNGSVYKMNKAAYSGEHNHAFMINGATNITIQDVKANDSGGDGFMIGGYQTPKSYSENITLLNVQADNNRRQGLSVIGVDGLKVDGAIFSNTGGANPSDGIDIEPEPYNGRCNNLLFRKVRMVNNAGKGVTLALQNLTAAMCGNNFTCTFEDCLTEGNLWGYSLQFVRDGVKGNIQFTRCTAFEAFYSGFQEASAYDGIKTTYTDCYAVNCNTSGTIQDIYSWGASFYVRDSGTIAASRVGNCEFIRCYSIDNRETPEIRRGFAANTVVDTVPNNITFIDCHSIGHSSYAYDFADVCENILINNPRQSEQAYVGNANVILRHLSQVLTNRGATGNVVLSLPNAKKDLIFRFRVEAANPLVILPKTGELLLGLQRSSASVVSSARVGDFLTIRGRDDGNWDVVNIKGIWSLIDAGTTAQRPAFPKTGQEFFDTTLGRPVWWTGAAWLDLADRPVVQTEITGSTVDMNAGTDFWKNILDDISLTVTNAADGKTAEVLIRNNDLTNPSTVTFAGISYPVGSDGIVPAGGLALFTLKQIDGTLIITAINKYS